jgi:hypothetical protein
MQRVTRKPIASRTLQARASEQSTGFPEIAIFSLLGLATTLFLAAQNWFPALLYLQ